jgi:hypothetical protein
MSNFKHPTTAGGPGGGGSRGDRGTIFIGSLDDTGLTVEAQYNPKELQVDKNIPWQKKNQANKTGATGIQLEFTGAEGRSMSVELLFDGYEQKASVSSPIEMLNQMASVIDPTSTDENKRRPHLCVCTWGSTVDNFKCVIESLSAKYTMFGEDGTPLRATCTVKLKEADAVSMATDSTSGATAEGGDGGE